MTQSSSSPKMYVCEIIVDLDWARSEKEVSHEWDEHAWFGLGATSRHRPAPAERGPPASALCGAMARAGRAGLCPAAAGRWAHESRLGRRPWRLYHASVERRARG